MYWAQFGHVRGMLSRSSLWDSDGWNPAFQMRQRNPPKRKYLE